MDRYIEIKEGGDSSSYFEFHPAIVPVKERIEDSDIRLLNETISIEEGDISCFLAYFFFKYFDKELYCNKYFCERVDGIEGEGFIWWLADNFYTYEAMDRMTEEILLAADLLESNYNDPSLDDI